MARAAPIEDPSASRLGLTRERILDAALRVLDRDGLDALSMRRLAEELGIGAMTLYGYFRGKDELLDAVVDHAARDLPATTEDRPWREGLRELMLAARRRHREHPAIVELRFRRPLVSPGALDTTEAAMRLLCEAGLSRREAARAYRTLFVYVFGFSAFGPGDRGEQERELTRATLASLPADRYPTLSGAAPEAADAMADQTVFELGLECLLDGLERRCGA